MTLPPSDPTTTNHASLPSEPLPIETFADAASAAARLAGEVLVDYLGSAKVKKKGDRDFVTEADFASQKVISEFLLQQFPNHRFVGEEDVEAAPWHVVPASESKQESSKAESEFCWIVDPLDGTTNYIHQLPSFSVSIGLYHRNQPLLGVVWDPVLEEMFVGKRGQGSTLNGETIQCSECDSRDDAMVVISLNRGVTRQDRQVQQFLSLLENVGTIRRLGSAALNLSYVAMGRIDAYWAVGLKPWDTAAGGLIATEAGAVLQGENDEPFSLNSPSFICASTAKLHHELGEVLAR